jgi:hypothetical protein
MSDGRPGDARTSRAPTRRALDRGTTELLDFVRSRGLER